MLEHEIYTVAIVFIGDFNPVIITPFWLSSKKLIRELEAQNAKVEVIHGEISRFEFDWARIEITKNKFEIRTSQEPYFDVVRDLIVGIFSILSETPIRLAGVNHLKYFALKNDKDYYHFGDRLSPLSNWSDVMNDPRMMLLDIVELVRKDGRHGKYRIRIMPSDVKLSTSFGVMIQVNDELAIGPSEDGRNKEIVELLSVAWKDSFERASLMYKKVWQIVSI